MKKKIAARLTRMMGTGVRWSFDWSEWDPTESEFSRAVSCIQLDEKERLGRYVFRKDTRASLVGRLMLRKFVNEHCAIPYEKIVFTRDENNKPILSNDLSGKSASFNVSHQGKFTVLAGVTRNVNLGIDVMRLEYTGGKELGEFFRIMGRNFSPREWTEIRGMESDTERIGMFCRHWALKESYVKAIGVGIVVDLGKLDFRTVTNLTSNNEFVVNDTSLWIDDARQEDWHFQETLLDREHCVSVAIQENRAISDSSMGKFEKLNFSDLVKNAVPFSPEDPRYARNYFTKPENPQSQK